MLNPAFDTIIAADPEDRLGLFNATATRLGTTPQNVEKDFWVSWTLDALFNGLPPSGPRLLFKGGTSLSKAYGLISRFSEDIDVTVFRQDLGEGASIEDLQALSGNKRRLWLDHLRDTCAAFIQGALREQLAVIAAGAAKRAGLASTAFAITIDAADQDGQSLLVAYPSVTEPDDYIPPTVKIESGARSALDPNTSRTLRAYVDADAPDLDLTVPNVTTVNPERTFWDKVLILHGLRNAFDAKGILRGEGQRVSRHYYDLYRMLQDPDLATTIADAKLSEDCAIHAKLFFNRPDANLDAARPPTWALSPHDGMVQRLAGDYALMQRMVFGQAPPFGDLLEQIAALEIRLNQN